MHAAAGSVQRVQVGRRHQGDAGVDEQVGDHPRRSEGGRFGSEHLVVARRTEVPLEAEAAANRPAVVAGAEVETGPDRVAAAGDAAPEVSRRLDRDVVAVAPVRDEAVGPADPVSDRRRQVADLLPRVRVVAVGSVATPETGSGVQPSSRGCASIRIP